MSIFTVEGVSLHQETRHATIKWAPPEHAFSWIWARGQSEHSVGLSAQSNRAFSQTEHSVSLNTQSIWAFSRPEHSFNLSFQSVWARGQSEFSVSEQRPWHIPIVLIHPVDSFRWTNLVIVLSSKPAWNAATVFAHQTPLCYPSADRSLERSIAPSAYKLRNIHPYNSIILWRQGKLIGILRCL